MPTRPEGVPDALARTLATRGWRTLTPVQRAVLEVSPPTADLLVSAPTGSGKTVAFGLAVAPLVLDADGDVLAPRSPRVLVITPTRELAAQVSAELLWLYGGTGLRVGCVTGGVDIRTERAALRRGYDLLVGSPGRLRGHVAKGALDLAQVECVILDEADDMLDMGFRADLEAVLDATPEGRRTLMFTATLTPRIEDLAARYQSDALRIAIGAEAGGNPDIIHRAVSVAAAHVDATIVNTLRLHDARAALVFCNRRTAVESLGRRLSDAGFRVAVLSGALDQTERTRAIAAMRDGRFRVCVATDVAARGLDLPHCSLVIHADLPRDRIMLLHRSGRTGRAGRRGISVMVVPHSRRRRAESLIEKADVSVTWLAPPHPADIEARDFARLRRHSAMTDPLDERDRASAAKLLAGHGAERIAAALWRHWQARRPAPQALSDAPSSGSVWFEIHRSDDTPAEVGHILPMIARIGRIRRKNIGRIRVRAHNVQFEILGPAAQHFAAAVDRFPEPGVTVRMLGSSPSRLARNLDTEDAEEADTNDPGADAQDTPGTARLPAWPAPTDASGTPGNED